MASYSALYRRYSLSRYQGNQNRYFQSFASHHKLLTQNSGDKFYPRGIALGSTTEEKTQHFAAFTLNSKFPVATLDYGYEVAGYPFFSVASLTGKVQVETR